MYNELHISNDQVALFEALFNYDDMNHNSGQNIPTECVFKPFCVMFDRFVPVTCQIKYSVMKLQFSE